MIDLKGTPGIPHYFETERLKVRRYSLNDDQILFEAARESVNEVYEFLPWCHPKYAIEDSRSWLCTIESSWADRQSWAFAITDKTSGRMLGGCGLNSIDENPVANLGYWIRTSEAGRGFVTEATRGLLKFGFQQLKLNRIEIIMSTKNTASRKVAVKVKGTLEGILRNRLHLHGQNHDALLYSLIPDDIKADLQENSSGIP